MTAIKKLLSVVLQISILATCAKIYNSEDAIPVAHSHKLIAIFPPTVSIARNLFLDAFKKVAR